MNIIRSGSQPSRKGPDSWFTGDVRIDAPFQASEPAKVGGATVTFEPGARTAWHTHPLGQTLIVTQGRGWLQEWGPGAYCDCRSRKRQPGKLAGKSDRRPVSGRLIPLAPRPARATGRVPWGSR